MKYSENAAPYTPPTGSPHKQPMPRPPTQEEIEEATYRVLIGKKSDVMLPRVYGRRAFNVWAFFFGSWYYFYRKMYNEGLVILSLEILFSALTNFSKAGAFGTKLSTLIYVLMAALSLALTTAAGVLFYRLYADDLRRRYRKLHPEESCTSAENLSAYMGRLRRTYDPTSAGMTVAAIAIQLAFELVIGAVCG